ncbi:MAG: OmpH family outer membrane protein [Mariniphaga sp.]|nr:OmpH family outer membrane protein [Mariniphaga sp.]
MKNSTIVNIVLALAVAGLYIIYFTGNKKDKSTEADMAKGADKPLTIAYVKMDSMLFTYELAKKLNTEFASKREDFKKEYTEKRIKFERDAASFQEKVQRGGFLTEDRARQEQERLGAVQQEVQKLDYDLTQKLTEMQEQIKQQIVDSISSFLKSYNETKRYDVILNSASMLEGSPHYNITKEVTQGLNDRYKSFTK